VIQTSIPHPRLHLHWLAAALWLGAACGGRSAGPGSGSSGGTTATGGSSSTGAGGAPASGGSGSSARGGSGGSVTGSGSGGTSTTGGGSGGAGPRGGSNGSGSGGSATGGSGSGGLAAGGVGGAHTTRDHCLYGYDPDPSDSDPAMKDGPSDFYPPNNMSASIVDTTVQPQVLTWMNTHRWEEAHVEWHAIRNCAASLGGGSASKVNICSYTNLVPTDQQCQTDGDGYQFLLFHRHMMQALKQLWPKHAEQFTGFPKFPQSAADVPPEWQSAWTDWSADALAAGKIGDAIKDPANLARFPNEGVLGFWLQCNVGQKLAMPANNMPFVGLHFLLHAKWVRNGNTTHGVNNTNANIDNYMFWKLHGWIDKVWQDYRDAKGLSNDDQKYKDDMLAQCREMDTEISIIQQKKPQPTDVNPNPNPLPVEHGFFVDNVRPIFDSKYGCSGCHDVSGPNGSLVLGGNISAADIIKGLVNVTAVDGPPFKYVVPGDPDNSWLYKKITGKTSDCTAAGCITGPMPPDTQVDVSAADAATIRQWIAMGAPGPS
jgi:hypothetical protein